MEPSSTISVRRPLDMHVHVVGNGLSGSGCWLRMRGWHKHFAGYILRKIKLNLPLDHPDFDRQYVAQLADLVRTSPLGAAVILAHDQPYTEQGEVLDIGKGLFVPNDYVLQLAREHPQFLPAISIHPARRDALAELDRCLAAGAVMMKLLPNCQNIDCCRPQYQPFWEKMAAAGLPLLAHTGGEHTVPVVDSAWADPRTLELPLACGVKVIAAHCGTGSGLFDPDYFRRFRAMAETFPNLYGDTSALLLARRSSALARCLSNGLSHCLVHGSDYPVPAGGLWLWLRGLITWRAYRRCQAIANPLERDYRLKIALGFGPEHFTRAWEILRRPGGS